MNMEALVRCTYWLGRARALAAMSDSQEVTEMLDKAVDSLCEALACTPAPVPKERRDAGDDVEWSE